MLSRATAFATRKTFATRAFTSTAPVLGEQYDVVVVGAFQRVDQDVVCFQPVIMVQKWLYYGHYHGIFSLCRGLLFIRHRLLNHK